MQCPLLPVSWSSFCRPQKDDETCSFFRWLPLSPTLLSGIIFGYTLAYILFVLPPLLVMDDRHVVGPSNFGTHDAVFPHFAAFSANESQYPFHTRIRLLCWVMTSPRTLKSRAESIKNTWAKRCNIILYMSSETDTSFPAIGLNTSEGRSKLYLKTIKAFEFIHDNYLDKADWFLKVDDDTYVIVENLKLILSKHNPEKALYFGKHFKMHIKQGYMSGGAGYLLSKQALKRYICGVREKKCNQKSIDEDVEIGRCLEIMAVQPVDTRDKFTRETFHPFALVHHLIPAEFPARFNLELFKHYSYHGHVDGYECCSDLSVSFHYNDPSLMHVMEYLVYYLRAYGNNFQSKHNLSHINKE
uniref:Glycoprotein-N-acetylgalactosamine 3-beta-galactosyltransferase 1 n=1 Tax=Eptatretus burgeri TaxID=7764 RepID=A0A8C4Q528_EPTBU